MALPTASLPSSSMLCAVPADYIQSQCYDIEYIITDGDKLFRLAQVDQTSTIVHWELIAGWQYVFQTSSVFTCLECLVSHMKCAIFALFLVVCLFRGM